MTLLYLFSKRSRNNSQAIKELIRRSSHTVDYYLLLVGSILLAIGGIFADSIPLLIASMIVAPLATPILGLGLGIVVGDWRLIGRVVGLLAASCILAVAIGFGIDTAFGDVQVHDHFVSFTGDKVLATFVAIISGAIAAYGVLRPNISSAVTGIAIAVSLMPPLVATAIGIASSDTELMKNAGLLFLLNFVGILIASIVVFLIFRIKKDYKRSA